MNGLEREFNQCLELVRASLTRPPMTDSAAIHVLRVFRRHNQFPAFRTRWPPQVSIVRVAHKHGSVRRHGKSISFPSSDFAKPLLWQSRGAFVNTAWKASREF